MHSLILFFSVNGCGACILSFIVVCSLAGCGGGEDDGYKGDRGSVSGKITYKGAAIPANSVVMFQSKEGSYSASGQVSATGEYKLTYNGKSTLPAVAYIVQVTPPPSAGTGPGKVPDPASVRPAEIPQSGSTMAPTKDEKTLPFPAKYTVATSSGFEFTVKSGPNTANFEMVDP